MTLKCIAGIEKPDCGTITLDGRVLFDSEKHINLTPQQRRVGYPFQQHALFPNMTAAQNILCGIRTGSRAEKKEKLAALLRTFRLEGLKKSSRRSSPAGSSSAWHWHGSWRRSRRRSYWTSRSPRSTATSSGSSSSASCWGRLTGRSSRSVTSLAEAARPSASCASSRMPGTRSFCCSRRVRQRGRRSCARNVRQPVHMPPGRCFLFLSGKKSCCFSEPLDKISGSCYDGNTLKNGGPCHADRNEEMHPSAPRDHRPMLRRVAALAAFLCGSDRYPGGISGSEHGRHCHCCQV